MGEVISISRVSDLDIFSEFDAQCPEIPEDIDKIISHSAENAVGKPNYPQHTGSFRVACIAVVLSSLVALAGVKFVASQLTGNFSGSKYGDISATGKKEWRESRESWESYITHLENDPRVVHLQIEREMFQQQYPAAN